MARRRLLDTLERPDVAALRLKEVFSYDTEQSLKFFVGLSVRLLLQHGDVRVIAAEQCMCVLIEDAKNSFWLRIEFCCLLVSRQSMMMAQWYAKA
uniref:Uncharacterized protein n=1 Tax=Ditylenchus dipsaci TaxID=166011 RepID=A0A915EQ64_9BILA